MESTLLYWVAMMSLTKILSCPEEQIQRFIADDVGACASFKILRE